MAIFSTKIPIAFNKQPITAMHARNNRSCIKAAASQHTQTHTQTHKMVILILLPRPSYTGRHISMHKIAHFSKCGTLIGCAIGCRKGYYCFCFIFLLRKYTTRHQQNHVPYSKGFAYLTNRLPCCNSFGPHAQTYNLCRVADTRRPKHGIGTGGSHAKRRYAKY